MSEILYVRDVARLRGVDIRTARRWLAQLEAAHGATVVGRFGGKVLYTTAEALASVTPKLRVQGRDEARFRDLEERLGEVERRLESHARKLGTQAR